MTPVYEGKTKAERRRFERRAIHLKLRFQCLDKDHVSGVHNDLAEDLGAGGLAMVSSQELQTGQLLMLTLLLPGKEGTPAGSSEVNVLSRVAWSKPAHQGGYLMGIQFLDLEPAERQLLKSFLVEFELDQPDSAMYT